MASLRLAALFPSAFILWMKHGSDPMADFLVAVSSLSALL